MAYDPQASGSHVERALAKVLEQFKGRPVIAAVQASFAKQVQKLEDAAWEVIAYKGIDNLSGKGLDDYGVKVGLRRLGLADPEYKRALKARSLVLKSTGTGPQLIAIAKLVLPDAFVFKYYDAFPLTSVFDLVQQASFSLSSLLGELGRAKGGASRVLVIYGPTDPSLDFVFAPGAASVDDTTHGMGDCTNPLIGGNLRGVVQTP